jgi:hypothetical protein
MVSILFRFSYALTLKISGGQKLQRIFIPLASGRWILKLGVLAGLSCLLRKEPLPPDYQSNH